MKREIYFLDERRKNWLVELESYEQVIIDLLNLNIKQQQL